ncbi:MAG TPA: hypothetical protein VFV38_05435, partial [Ktedonobacteraceae bacterium]|nr:hypothetical protein [Ktedonobacteraceae bacterium]
MVTNPHHVQSGESEISYSPGLQDQAQAICNTPGQAPSDCIQYILHLLWISQDLSRHHSHAPTYLCQEVRKITQGHAQLVLAQNEANFTEETKLHFAVQFGDIVYGTLYVIADKQRPAYPALSAPGAHLLAQVCGW